MLRKKYFNVTVILKMSAKRVWTVRSKANMFLSFIRAILSLHRINFIERMASRTRSESDKKAKETAKELQNLREEVKRLEGKLSISKELEKTSEKLIKELREQAKSDGKRIKQLEEEIEEGGRGGGSSEVRRLKKELKEEKAAHAQTSSKLLRASAQKQLAHLSLDMDHLEVKELKSKLQQATKEIGVKENSIEKQTKLYNNLMVMYKAERDAAREDKRKLDAIDPVDIEQVIGKFLDSKKRKIVQPEKSKDEPDPMEGAQKALLSLANDVVARWKANKIQGMTGNKRLVYETVFEQNEDGEWAAYIQKPGKEEAQVEKKRPSVVEYDLSEEEQTEHFDNETEEWTD